MNATTDGAPARRPSHAAIAVAALLLAGGALYLANTHSTRLAALYGIGAMMGLALYHATFGFTSAWRAFLTDGRGAGLRAQMVMLAVASLLFLPVLTTGEVFGRPAGGAIAPLTTSLVVGAFLFGIGMQFGGGCASGTLFAVGGGSPRMVITLAGFIAGSVIATAHFPWWLEQPGVAPVSLIDSLGAAPAALVQFGALGAILLATIAIERHRHGAPKRQKREAFTIDRLFRGPWPLLWGALALALLNAATLALAGHPWAITFGLGLWGAKILAATGTDVATWTYWTWPYPAQALAGSIFAEVTSVMNFGIVAGALLAAGLARRYAPNWRIAPRDAALALAGGLLLGYGARLAFGCNIGAFFSGVASFSLHGWVWFAAALVGNFAGTRLRPLLMRN